MNRMEKLNFNMAVKKTIGNIKGTIVIYPYGQFGQRVGEHIKKKRKNEVIGIDNYRAGKDTISFDQFIKKYKAGPDLYTIIITSLNNELREEIVKDLISNGVNRTHIKTFTLHEKKNRSSKKNKKAGLSLSEYEKFRRGRSIVKKITKDRLDSLYLFSLCNIGDTIALSAFSSNVKLMYNANRLVLVCRSHHKDIKDMFGGAIDECIPLSSEDINAIWCYIERSYDFYGANYIIGNYLLFERSYNYFSQRTTQFKSLILQIPESCAIDEVSKDFYGEYDNTLISQWEKSVILSPYAYSLPLLDWSFWYNLSEGLKSRGYEVYTNTSGKEHEIRGTKRFDKGLKEAFQIGSYCRALISYRSGFSDFMAFNHKLNHIVISPNEFEVKFSNVAFYGSNKITNIIYSGNNDKSQIIDKIISSI